jgi:hypothetical protein
VIGFPEPPALVLKALALLEVASRGDPDETAGMDLDDLPKPWDPTTCPAELRASVWHWCDQVAGWLNRQHAWHPQHAVPACWPYHPHIASELPVLAVLRWAAHESTSCAALDEWHTHALPLFQERTAARLGRSCHYEHSSWPSYTEDAMFHSDQYVEARAAIIEDDSALAL